MKVLLLAAATLAVYWPAIHGGFLFDDESLLTSSTLVLASDGLRRIWFTAQAIDYWPVTNSSFWIEWRLWGMDPTGYHATNVLLHAGSALLVWSVLRRLSIPGAWLAAMLFALHPMNVQSVAWIAQRKNALSMLFFLLSVAAFLRHERNVRPRAAVGDEASVGHKGKHRPRTFRADGHNVPDAAGAPGVPLDRWYWLSLCAFVFAMLSKGSVAILPGVLLVLIWWGRGRITGRDLAKIAPFLAVAVALTLVNLWFQARMPGGTRDVTMVERALGAGGVIWFYLAKALLPIKLTFIYPQWDVRGGELRWWLPSISALAVTAVLIRQRRRPIARSLLCAWVFFCLALLPVMGFTDVYFMKYSLVADHYGYIALVGVVAAGAAFLRGSRVLAHIVWAALLVVLGTLTWRQAHLYAGAETLYRATLESNPSAWALHNNLGALLVEQSKYEEAARHLREALRLQPDFVQAHNNLCDAAARLGNVDEVLKACSASLRLNPRRARSHNSLGLAFASSGRLAEARIEFEAALSLNPNDIDAHSNLADLLRATGQPAEAAEHYRRVLFARPDSAWAHNGYGSVLVDLGDPATADAAFREAIRLNPRFAEPHRNLGDLLAEFGRFDEAAAVYRQALLLDSRSAEIHNNLGVVLVRLGRHEEAVDHFQSALALDPNLADARANLAKVAGRRGATRAQDR